MKTILTGLLVVLQFSFAYTQIGSLDSDFSADGRVTHDFGFDEDLLNDLAIQPDGKIVAAGSTLDGSPGTAALLRYNPDGTLDNNFGGTGTILPFQGYSSLIRVSIDANQKIVAAGNRDFSNDIWVIRLSSNGSYDSTFSFDGQAVIDLGGVEVTRDMLIQPDGKIVVCAVADNRPAFIRLNSDGTLDPTFSGDGKLTLGFLVDNTIGCIARQSSGKLVAAFANEDSSEFTALVTRINTNGTEDNSFATAGEQIIDLSPADVSSTLPVRLVIDPSDRVLIAGRTFTSTNTLSSGFVVRLQPNGSLDNTFNSDGVFIRSISKGNRADAIACQSDGKYVVGFTIDTFANANMEVIRLLSDGTTDGSFVDINSFPPQTIQVDFANRSERLTALLLQPNGRIVIGGRAQMTSDVTSVEFAVARLLNDVELSVNENVSVSQIRLFPNPATDNFNLEIDGTDNATFTVHLTNAIGQYVTLKGENHTLDGNKNIFPFTLPSDIAKGIYNLSIQLESGNTINHRLVVAD